MKRHAHRQARAPMLSQPRRVTAGCSGKRCYETASIAMRLAKRMRRDLDKYRGDAYHCQHCHLWHIGER